MKTNVTMCIDILSSIFISIRHDASGVTMWRYCFYHEVSCCGYDRIWDVCLKSIRLARERVRFPDVFLGAREEGVVVVAEFFVWFGRVC